MDKLAIKVKKIITETGMALPGDKVLMAVSGGPDSVAMAHIFAGLRDELKIELSIGHLDHSARGVESEEDARFVVALGESLGVKTFVDKIDVAGERQKYKTSFQETARILRRNFLETALEKFGGNRIALGHIADDQAETFLINLLRGSGLKGLAGMPSISGFYVRPLLGCFKNEILEYLSSHGLAFRDDKSNAERDYLRNRIRLDLIPHLEQFYNVNIKQNIIETANIIRDEDNYLAELVETVFAGISHPFSDGSQSVELIVSRLNDFPPAIRKRLVRHAIFLVKGDLRKISSRHIHDVLKLVMADISGKRVCLPGNLSAILAGGVLRVYKKVVPPRGVKVKRVYSQAKVSLSIPGDTCISGSPVTFKARLVPKIDHDFSAAPSNKAWLDFDKTGGSILIRFFQPGDVFVPLGMTGSKKLKSFFIDEKTPMDARRHIPLLATSANDIIWVFDKRISNKYRVTEGTRKVLLVEGMIGGK